MSKTGNKNPYIPKPGQAAQAGKEFAGAAKSGGLGIAKKPGKSPTSNRRENGKGQNKAALLADALNSAANLAGNLHDQKAKSYAGLNPSADPVRDTNKPSRFPEDPWSSFTTKFASAREGGKVND